MTIAIFDNFDFSNQISITKELPPYKKLIDNFDTKIMLEEMENFISLNLKNPVWYKEFNVDTNKASKSLQEINLLENYNQWQMSEVSTEVPCNKFLPEIGDYTKNLLSSITDIHRPRYVKVNPGWNIKEHVDWNDNKKNGLRCHLIIKTPPEANHFVKVNNQWETVHFGAGEIWFLNVEYPHRAENLGEYSRYGISFELFTDELVWM